MLYWSRNKLNSPNEAGAVIQTESLLTLIILHTGDKNLQTWDEIYMRRINLNNNQSHHPGCQKVFPVSWEHFLSPRKMSGVNCSIKWVPGKTFRVPWRISWLPGRVYWVEGKKNMCAGSIFWVAGSILCMLEIISWVQKGDRFFVVLRHCKIWVKIWLYTLGERSRGAW